MKQIPLTKGQFALVDEEDFDYLNQFNWQACKYKKTFYASRTESKTHKTIRMHREILGVVDPKIDIDHKDHNGLNNCRNNLRVATRSQNSANRASHNGSESKYKGIYLEKKYNGSVWTARIQKEDKRFHIGCFNNEIDAALAYNKKAIELYGEFANLNIINK